MLVIDTCLSLAGAGGRLQLGGQEWTPHLNALRGILQRTAAGGILLHHSTKATGRYRDSSAIGAGVDAILEMSPAQEDPVVRQVRARGRMVMADFRLRFVDPWYQLEGGDLPLDLRIYRVVQGIPGASQNRIREAVYGSTKAIDRTLGDLCRRGAIEDRGNGHGHAYHVKLFEASGRARVEEVIEGEREGRNSIESNGVEVESRSRTRGTTTPPYIGESRGEARSS